MKTKTKIAGGKEKFDEAIEAGRLRDYKRAVLLLEELISGFEAPPRAYLYLGRSFHAIGDYSRALAAFNDYVRLENGAWEGYFFGGRTYLAIAMPHKALPPLRKALELNPENPAVMAMLGAACLRARRSAEAVDLLQKAVETAAEAELPQAEQRRIYRAYINALLIRGIRLCRNEEYDLGIQMLRFVLANSEAEGEGRRKGKRGSTLLRLELGRACREAGLPEEALEHYTAALDRAPQDQRIRWYRASILMSLGEKAEALKDIERIRAVDSGLPDLPWNGELVDLYMIRAFLDTGEWRRAADACRGWIKNRGESAVIHSLYAEALRNLSDYTAALNHLERAEKLEGRDIELWYQTILTAWEGENWKILRKALRIADSLKGDGDIIRRFSILLEAKTGEDDEKIITLLQNAVRTLGPEPELMYALGERYLKTGLPRLALSWFRKTISLRERHERSRLGEIAALEALIMEPGDESSGTLRGLLAAAERRTRQGETPDGDLLAEELRAAYDGYVRFWPDNYIIRRERALYLIHTFEYEEAVPELEALLTWEPSNQSLRRVLAYGYRKTGRFREAAVFLKGLLKERPRSVDLLIEYSGCLERAGAVYYARAVLEKAMSAFGRAPEIPLALGLLYYRENRLERAFDLLREAAARNVHDPRPYQWMASLARKSGDAAGAAKFEQEVKKRARR
ncbi:MAG: tetratricopeptide repeat protein [Treponema sp.]|nr:tetratricopeptide repeat protein [Treponema sp.]